MRSNKYLKFSILVILVVSAFWVGTVFAATACFNDTNGHPNEIAICWLKENGIVGGTNFKPNNAATRATVAQWLYRQVQIPPSTGTILITPGNSEWQKFDSDDTSTFTYYSSTTRIEAPTTGTRYFTIQPSVPNALYGRSLRLLGVEFCYDAQPAAYLSYVEINTVTATSGAGTRILQFSDSTDRTDAACRYYVLPTPVTLTADDGVSFYISVTWSATFFEFDTARTTFVFQPTTTKIVPPSAESADAVILTESTGTGEDSTTTAP